jgi:hypothetical protein
MPVFPFNSIINVLYGISDARATNNPINTVV